MDTNFEPLLSVQCWRIINEHLDEAVKVKQARNQYFDEDQFMYEDVPDAYDIEF